LRAVETFAGIGGLALGLAQAGFEHHCVVEWDHDACRTLRHNKLRKVEFVRDWQIHEADVRRFPFELIPKSPALVSGGVPCQPFSLGGKHRGHLDDRNMFPAFIDVVRCLEPEAILVENVKGLLRESFATYFNYVVLQLKHPEVRIRAGDDWPAHLATLEEVETSGSKSGLNYNVVYQLVNAADFGVPQRRERVFIVGIRTDLGVEWAFPLPTHSREALNFDQHVDGSYWQRHDIKPPSESAAGQTRFVDATSLPWVTVRDAIVDLPPFGSVAADQLHHKAWPGARAYPGHTGSMLDLPAKALKAGDHGVPGGENTIVLDDGSVRYMSVREAARIQTFPDEFHFPGTWTDGLRQLGNAVPVELAERLASSLAYALAREPGVRERHEGIHDRAALQPA
jgi:DNA (cytosine-5)-methyltransferase 1